MPWLKQTVCYLRTAHRPTWLSTVRGKRICECTNCGKKWQWKSTTKRTWSVT